MCLQQVDTAGPGGAIVVSSLWAVQDRVQTHAAGRICDAHHHGLRSGVFPRMVLHWHCSGHSLRNTGLFEICYEVRRDLFTSLARGTFSVTRFLMLYVGNAAGDGRGSAHLPPTVAAAQHAAAPGQVLGSDQGLVHRLPQHALSAERIDEAVDCPAPQSEAQPQPF